MMKLSVVGKNGSVSAQGEKRVHLVYLPAYRPGDTILLEVDAPGLYKVRLEDTLPPAVVYLSETQAHFPIPFGNERGVIRRALLLANVILSRRKKPMTLWRRFGGIWLLIPLMAQRIAACIRT